MRVRACHEASVFSVRASCAVSIRDLRAVCMFNDGLVSIYRSDQCLYTVYIKCHKTCVHRNIDLGQSSGDDV